VKLETERDPDRIITIEGSDSNASPLKPVMETSRINNIPDEVAEGKNEFSSKNEDPSKEGEYNFDDEELPGEENNSLSQKSGSHNEEQPQSIVAPEEPTPVSEGPVPDWDGTGDQETENFKKKPEPVFDAQTQPIKEETEDFGDFSDP
jgi:hypothetical protein